MRASTRSCKSARRFGTTKASTPALRRYHCPVATYDRLWYSARVRM